MSVPCPYHVYTASLPRLYHVNTNTWLAPARVCFSWPVCARVSVFASFVVVCARTGLVCLCSCFSMPSQCLLNALSMPSQCPLDALLMPPQCLLHAFSMAEHLAAGSEGWGPRRRAPTSRLSSSLHRMHSLSQRTVAPRSLGWP